MIEELNKTEMKVVGGGDAPFSADGWTFYSEEGGSIFGVDDNGNFMSIYIDDEGGMEFNYNGDVVSGHINFDEWGEGQSLYIDGVGSLFIDWERLIEEYLEDSEREESGMI